MNYINLNEIDFDAVQEQVSTGYINKTKHPIADLWIYNYTQKTQYEWYWTPETSACRGLIIDSENNIIARPFRKFFSYEQLNKHVPNEPFDVYEKLDGSLGILYHINGQAYIATRGSFNSPQAIIANKILKSKYPAINFNPELTYLVEIIHPETRVIVDYGSIQDLYLLAVINTQTGIELPLLEIETILPKVKTYHGINEFNQLLEMQQNNAEGFVVRFQSGLRVKLKFEEYKRLHKLITGINSYDVWQRLSTNTPLTDLIDKVPDEYYLWIKSTEEDLNKKYATIKAQALKDFKVLSTRKATAQYFKQCKNPDLLFAILDNKRLDEVIWRKLKPKRDIFFKQDSDN